MIELARFCQRGGHRLPGPGNVTGQAQYLAEETAPGDAQVDSIDGCKRGVPVGIVVVYQPVEFVPGKLEFAEAHMRSPQHAVTGIARHVIALLLRQLRELVSR